MCWKTQPAIFIISEERFLLFKFVKKFKIKASSYELKAMQDVWILQKWQIGKMPRY